MVYANSFRYGEISSRNAGRFDSDAYRHGCFTFRNMVTDFTGAATRRAPIRKLIDTDAELIIEFSISETLAYTIGIAKKKLRIYSYVLGEYKEISNVAYPGNMALTSAQIKELRWAQYYTRMYFVHQDFRPFFIDFEPSSDSITISSMTIILNQDAKNRMWFTPAYVEDADGNEDPSLEGRVLYSKEIDGVTHWFLDEDMEEEYEYASTYPPIHGSSNYISGYDDQKDDDLLTTENDYPGGIAIISDSLYLFSTKKHPQRLWKSRVLGSSQWIEGFEADTMHDFVQFQMVWTESKEMVDDDEIPMKEMTDVKGNVYYEQENGNDVWYLPDKDANGNYTYQTRVYWSKDLDDWDDDDPTYWYLNPEDPEGSKYDAGAEGGDRYPKRKPLKVADFSDTSKLFRSVAAIDYVKTDSCALWVDLNSGRMDKLNDVVPGCGYIFVMTSNGEWRLPAAFSAVNNLRTIDGNEPYTFYGSQNIRAVNLNGSVLFLQKSGILREFYLYQGYMANGDVTTLNHDILSSGVFQIVAKNTPDPRLYFIMDNGTCVVLTYDKENSIQSFSPWDMKDRHFVSAAKLSGPLKDTMLFLIYDSSTDDSWIGYLDEDESEDFSDEGKVDYVSDIATPYIEVVDNNLVFGRYKKAQIAWIRPYETGHIETGNKGDSLTVSKKMMMSNDEQFTLTGLSRRQSSFEIRAHRNEPMTILAYAYEVM